MTPQRHCNIHQYSHFPSISLSNVNRCVGKHVYFQSAIGELAVLDDQGGSRVNAVGAHAEAPALAPPNGSRALGLTGCLSGFTQRTRLPRSCREATTVKTERQPVSSYRDVSFFPSKGPSSTSSKAEPCSSSPQCMIESELPRPVTRSEQQDPMNSSGKWYICNDCTNVYYKATSSLERCKHVVTFYIITGRMRRLDHLIADQVLSGEVVRQSPGYMEHT